MPSDKNRYPFALIPFFGMLYVAQAIYQTNINNYLLWAGLEPHIVARIGSVLPIAGVAGLYLFGRAGDRAKSKNMLLIALTAVSACLVFLLGQGESVAYVMAIMCLNSFVYLSIEPLLTTISLETLDRTRSSFGPLRAIGTVTYALATSVVGFLIDDQWGRIIWMSTAALLLCAASGFLLPKVAGHAREKKERVSPRVLFKNKSLMLMIAFCFFLMISTNMFYAVFSMYVASDAITGGVLAGSRLVNIASTVGAIAEVPFLIFADRIFKKIGVGAMLVISALAIALRMTLIYFVSNPYQILATQVLHGWGFIAIAFAMAKFINIQVPAQLKASGQMLYTILSVTLARSVGQLAASFITQYMSMRENFLAGAAVALFAAVVFGILIWKNPQLRNAGKETAAA